MAQSLSEQYLVQVKSELAGATAAGSRVFRDLFDALSANDYPALVIRRGPEDRSKFTDSLVRVRFEFSVEARVAGADVETQADELHVEVYQQLMRSAPLAALGKGLECVGTEPSGDGAAEDFYRLAARYQVSFLTRAGDLAQPAQ